MKLDVERCIGGSLESGYGCALGFDYLLEGSLKWVEIKILFVCIGLYWGKTWEDEVRQNIPSAGSVGTKGVAPGASWHNCDRDILSQTETSRAIVRHVQVTPK